MEVQTLNPNDKETPTSTPKDGGLPECKIKRNYSCNHCNYSTQNPRSHLEHLRDIHCEKIFINKCCLCLYASRHYQKLVRHMKMVHGSIEGICEQSKKRPYSDISTWFQQPRKISSPPLPPLLPLPEPVETTINMNNLSNDLDLSRNALKDIAALYFAQSYIDQIMVQMEQADAMHLLPTREAGNSYNELKSSVVSEERSLCNCGYAAKCFSEYTNHRRYCCYSNGMPSMNLNQCQNCGQWCKSSVDLLHHQCNYLDEVSINLSSVSTRCQQCRLWCKSNTDLMNHLQNCSQPAGLQNKDSHLDMNTKKIGGSGGSYLENCGTSRHSGISNGEIKQDTRRECNEDKSYFAIETAPGYGKVIKKMTPREELPSESLKKVFKCPRCSFWASTASRFHIHIVGHLNKKPFKCSLCDYRSNWRWDITKHIRIKTVRSNCHKNARVVVNSEGGRVDYAKYNRYVSLIKITDEDGVDKLTESHKVIENQVDTQPIPPNDALLRDQKRDVNIDTPARNEGRTSQFFEASHDAKNNGDDKEIVFKPQKSPMRHAKGKTMQFQGTIQSVGTQKSLLSSSNSIRGNQIPDNSNTLHDYQVAAVAQEQKSEPNNNSLLKGYIQQERPSKTIVEATQSDKNTPQSAKGVVEASSSYSRTKSSAMDATQSEPSPFRCGHCHQVSNWKHVIQRHCRLKHSGYIRIEAFDRSSDWCHPVYHPFEIYGNRKSLNLLVSSANELDDSKRDHHSQDSFHSSHSDQDLVVNNFEMSRLPSGSNHFRCPSCPYVSKTKNQLNMHVSTHGTHNTAVVVHPKPLADETSSAETKLLNNLIPEDTVSALKKCPYCPFQSTCGESFQQHLQCHICVSNRSESHTCEHCDFSTSSEDIIVEHARFHFVANDSKKSLTSFTSCDNLELIVTKNSGKAEDTDSPTSRVIAGKTDNEQMPSPSQKTILVNPKTGQVIKKSQ